MKTIYDKLRAYSASDYYGFHMPGHKRLLKPEWSVDPYQLDITEIEGFDDLHHPLGILKEAQERAARIYGADETYFLINGSTVGILSAILGVTKKGDAILVARNCHKSVYHGIYLNELNPIYLYPRFDDRMGISTEISDKDIKRALEEHPEIRAVVIVSPTYEGVVSDISKIADTVHKYQIPLIVDEAHGAHFGFHPYFPENSNRLGADLVIHSVHKTLPVFTQTALLHVNGTIVDRARIKRYLDILQSSSPSYILMAGIDWCMDLLEQRAGELFPPYVQMLKECREELDSLKKIKIITPKKELLYDSSKLVISVSGVTIDQKEATGKWLLEKLLHEYHLQMEMAAGNHIIAMTSIGDTKEGFLRLTGALSEIDVRIVEEGKAMECGNVSEGGNMERISSPMARSGKIPEANVEMKLAAAIEERGKRIPLDEAERSISKEYAYLYPPGIPILVPGERVTKEIIAVLQWYKEKGYSIEGPGMEGYIEVLIDG